jgi:NADH:ubiquinone oxidoreductase subunit D/NADH:ubiquinone oxidoreductase subunit C
MKTAEAVFQAFPAVQPDQRPGYQGILVPVENLVDVVTALKADAGYTYLTCVTGVDYLPENKMEVVYHLRRLNGGTPMELKVQVDRADAHVPSLMLLFAGADLQEREAYDLLGIRFDGHPNLKRILTWEGFNGHPLRKDWREALYEQDAKPYKSRWPEGKYQKTETLTPFGENVSYPLDFDPGHSEDVEKELRHGFSEPVTTASEISGEHLVVNLGPQHPSTHGVFRMVVELDSETVVKLEPVIGYLHRNHEKICERNSWLQNMPFTDRLDYLSSLSNNFAYALAVEKLAGITPTDRANYIRVIMAELTRISSHLIAVGFLMNDLGVYFTASLYGLEERELILDIFEAVTGSRMMCNYLRFGGVARDLPEGTLGMIYRLAFDRLPRKLDDFEKYLLGNEIVKVRCQGVGVLTPQQAINYSASGPVLRASGVGFDLRKAEPYGVYDRFEFDVPVTTHGDTYDRLVIRMREIRESVRIIQQAIKSLPNGPVMNGKPTINTKVPPGESYGAVEGPKGELGFYLVSNGSANPWRYHVRPPTFINLTSLGEMSKDVKIADLVVILGGIDINLGEVDR